MCSIKVIGCVADIQGLTHLHMRGRCHIQPSHRAMGASAFARQDRCNGDNESSGQLRLAQVNFVDQRSMRGEEAERVLLKG